MLGAVLKLPAVCRLIHQASLAQLLFSKRGGHLGDQGYGLMIPTARGFEPLRAEPNGFRVHLLNRSDTLS